MTELGPGAGRPVRDDGVVALVGAAAGLVLVLLGLSPTGSVAIDVVVTMAACSAAFWCAAAAPWWMIAALAAVGTALASNWGSAILGVLVIVDAVVLARFTRSTEVTNAVLLGGAVVVLAFARELGTWGANAAVALGATTIVIVVGACRRRDQRRIILVAAAATTAIVGVTVAAAVVVAQSARDELQHGNRVARTGLRHLEAGDFDAARTSFTEAAAAFDDAAGSLRSPLTQPARLVPIVSQHMSAGSGLSDAAASATQTVVEQLRTIDVDALRIDDGRIDLAAVASLSDSMAELQAAIDELDAAVSAARSGWLVDPVLQVLDDLTDDLDRQRVRGERAVQALDVAPAFLGADGERVYFVMFTTPAEARGQGGFMGNWAEISIDAGKISMTRFGADEELNEAGERPRVLEHAPEDWLARYGQFGFVKGPDGVVGEVPWKNITMSPNFPATSQVVAELYPKSGGRDIDGVFNLDVYALEELIGVVGPIDVAGIDEPLTGENAARFLMFDQYLEEDQDVRGDQLEAVSRAVVDRLLRDAPPDPLELGKAMAPLTKERRLMAWSAHPDEQQLFETLGIDGALRADAGQMVSVALVNGGGSKIDTFLEHDIEVVDGPDGVELHLEVTNGAPAGGLPDYLIGNLVGLPTGTSRLWITGYATVPVTAMESSHGPLDSGAGAEAGLYARSAFIDLGPGESTTVVFSLDAAGLHAADFAVVRPPLAR